MGRTRIPKRVAMGLLASIVCMLALLPGYSEAGPCAAIIYEHANYQGAAQCLRGGRYNINDLEIGNDTLSSIQVSSGTVVILFEHSNYSGRSATVRSSLSYVGDSWNDIVSSIIVE